MAKKPKLSRQNLARTGVRENKQKVEFFQTLPVCSAPVRCAI